MSSSTFLLWLRRKLEDACEPLLVQFFSPVLSLKTTANYNVVNTSPFVSSLEEFENRCLIVVNRQGTANAFFLLCRLNISWAINQKVKVVNCNLTKLRLKVRKNF